MNEIEKTTKTGNNEKMSYNFNHLKEIAPDKIPNAVLARLIDEVRNDEILLTNHSYNRFHNRHNR